VTTRPLKIAFAHMFTLRTPRGIERYIINAANALARLGQDVTIIAGRCADSPTRGWIDGRVQVREIRHRNWHKLSFVPSFLGAFLAEDYDVVNIAIARADGYAAGIASLLKRFRFNIIFHYPYENHEKHVRAFRRFGTADRADGLVAVSDYAARGISRYLGRPVVVVPNGVDPGVFRPDPERRARTRGELGIPGDAPVLLTVSALQGRKGIGNVLQAVSRLRQLLPAVRYVVVGDGNSRDREEFFAQVRSQGLEEAVLFLGNRSDVAPFYNAADLFVFLPSFEAFGIVTIEAMASRLPVVVSTGSAFPELLAAGGGVMVDPDDPALVAETLHSLLADRERLQQLGEEGRQSVLQRFTWDKIAARLLELFRKQVAADARGRG
jgi:glycosyltransferase involved in cell wall biosynthesis